MQFLSLSNFDKWWFLNFFFKYLHLTPLNFRYNSKERKVTRETKRQTQIFYLNVVFMMLPHLVTSIILMARLLQGDESLYHSEIERGLRMTFGAFFISVNFLYFVFVYSIIVYLQSYLQAFNSVFSYEKEMISTWIILG
jgi:hypothetical protein